MEIKTSRFQYRLSKYIRKAIIKSLEEIYTMLSIQALARKWILCESNKQLEWEKTKRYTEDDSCWTWKFTLSKRKNEWTRLSYLDSMHVINDKFNKIDCYNESMTELDQGDE